MLKLVEALIALKDVNQGMTQGVCQRMDCEDITCANCPLNNIEHSRLSKLFTALELSLENRTNTGFNAPPVGSGNHI
jgi:hypothetical protein